MSAKRASQTNRFGIQRLKGCNGMRRQRRASLSQCLRDSFGVGVASIQKKLKLRILATELVDRFIGFAGGTKLVHDSPSGCHRVQTALFAA